MALIRPETYATGAVRPPRDVDPVPPYPQLVAAGRREEAVMIAARSAARRAPARIED